MTKSIFINQKCVETSPHFMKELLDCFSEHFDVTLYSLNEKESDRLKVEDWLIESELPIDEVLLRPDDNWNPAETCLLQLIEGKKPLVFIEGNEYLVQALRNDGHKVLEYDS